MEDETRQENIVRSILQSEYSWIGGILLVGWAFVTQVILPISAIQIQLGQIQLSLNDSKKFEQRITTTDTDFNSRISVLESEFNNISK